MSKWKGIAYRFKYTAHFFQRRPCSAEKTNECNQGRAKCCNLSHCKKSSHNHSYTDTDHKYREEDYQGEHYIDKTSSHYYSWCHPLRRKMGELHSFID